ncbi:MAG: YtoQ family protein [Spirochaetaceae bacterium]|nr:YtoQ family protein [Spirochaetaceae bacterium]
MQRTLKVYLAGEIHSDWRGDLAAAIERAGVRAELLAPVTDHDASDQCGVRILGEEDKAFWRDHKGAGINAIRTRTLLRLADVVVVKFGEHYRQWNAAYDAGFAAALGTPVITLHDDGLSHALKEVDAAAMAVAATVEQVAQILRYVLSE